MPRVIDVHVHRLDDSHVEWARELGYERVCLMDHRVDVLKDALRKHPDFVVATGYLPLQKDVSEALDAIERYREIGCIALKACGANARYDDERHWPVYARAEELGLPILFHTGWLDWRLASVTFEMTNRSLADWYHPMTLDRIALEFPRLKVVALHMGVTWVAEAATLMKQYPNVYADSCNGYLAADGLDAFVLKVGGRSAALATLSKTLYGTDGMATPARHQGDLADMGKVMDMLRMTPALRERLWHRNALHVLGLDDELKKVVSVPRVASSSMTLDAFDAAGPARLDDFLDNELERYGLSPRFPVKVRLGWDDRALTLLVRCAENSPEKLVTTKDGPVDDIWQDDSVEIFLSPGEGDDYRHVVISAGGRVALQHRRGEMIEQPSLAKVRVGRDAWESRVSVPFDLLGATPRPGDRWGLQICRSKHTDPAEVSTWSEVSGTFHDPTGFGRMVLR